MKLKNSKRQKQSNGTKLRKWLSWFNWLIWTKSINNLNWFKWFKLWNEQKHKRKKNWTNWLVCPWITLFLAVSHQRSFFCLFAANHADSSFISLSATFRWLLWITSSMQSKRCDLHHTWLNRETNEKLRFFLIFITMNTHNLFHETVFPFLLLKFFAFKSSCF